MRSLIRKQNYRMIPLTDPPSSTETVGVYMDSGKVLQLPWRGFIDRDRAVSSGARPIRLDIVAIVPNDQIGTARVELRVNEFAQGALLDGAVYGVLDAESFPRIIVAARTHNSSD